MFIRRRKLRDAFRNELFYGTLVLPNGHVEYQLNPSVDIKGYYGPFTIYDGVSFNLSLLNFWIWYAPQRCNQPPPALFWIGYHRYKELASAAAIESAFVACCLLLIFNFPFSIKGVARVESRVLIVANLIKTNLVLDFLWPNHLVFLHTNQERKMD